MSKEEGLRRMKAIGQLFTLTGIAVPVISIVVGNLGGGVVLELFIYTFPVWTLMLLAGAAMWVVAYIKEGYLQS
jgi:hypothetical protein